MTFSFLEGRHSSGREQGPSPGALGVPHPALEHLLPLSSLPHRVQKEQLAAIFKLMKENKETFGEMSDGDVQEQLRLYDM